MKTRLLWPALYCCLWLPAQGMTPAATSEPVTTPAPDVYHAHYKARANGLNAKAQRSLILMEDGALQLKMELAATIFRQEIARLEQTSHFTIDVDGVHTRDYNYDLGGISSDLRHIVFDWENGVALSSEDDESWSLPLSGQTYDPLSHQHALREALRSGSSTELVFAVVDGDEIDEIRYRILGEEVLETPLGLINTVKLERVRKPESERSTVIWFATDWQYLLARIEQVSGSGLRLQLELEAAEINGEAVTPLP